MELDYNTKSVSLFFQDLLDDLECLDETKSYITGIFKKYTTAQYDLSNHSATVLFAQARSNHNFLHYQSLGDWIFYSSTMFPESLHFASKDYYDTIARLSYYSCYRIINKQWQCFEEIADNYIVLENNVRILLRDINQ